MIHLSKRLQTVVSLVTPGHTVADVGCDHAHTGIYLVQAGISPRVVAMDLRPGPLEKAKENVLAEGVTETIDLRLSDGLEALKEGETDTVLISGMGGPLILTILEKELSKAKAAKELILSPQSDLEGFKEGLSGLGFGVTKTLIVKDDKFYFVFKAVYGVRDAVQEPEPAEVWLEYLTKEAEVKKRIFDKLKADDGEKAVARRSGLYDEIRRIEDEINRMRNRKGI